MKPTQQADPATPVSSGMRWRRGILGTLLVVIIGPALMFGTPYMIATYYNWQGDALQSRGDFSAAAHSYRTAIRIRPVPRTLEKLGGTYIKAKRPAAAIAAFQRALTLAPADSNTRYHVGLGLLKLGQVQNAQQQLNEAVKLDTHNGMAHLALSNLAAAKGDQATSIRELETAVDDGANTGDAHLRMAQLYLIHGDPRAEKELRAALSVDPALAPAQLRLGCLLLNSDTREAAVHLQKALDLGIASPDDRARALIGMALVAYRESDLAGAKSYLQQAEAAQPGPDIVASLDYALGVVRRDDSNAIGSLEAFNAAIKQRRCIPAFRMGAAIGRLTLYGQAMMEEREGRFGDAVRDYTLLSADDPHDAQLRIHLGSALMAQNELPHAIAELRAATTLAPSNPQTWLKLSAALLQSGKIPESSAALTRALHLAPHWTLYRPDVDVQLGELDLAQNRPDAAALCFRFAAQSHSTAVDPDNCLALLEIATQRSQQLAEAARATMLAKGTDAIAQAAAPADPNAISLTAEKRANDDVHIDRVVGVKSSDRPSSKVRTEHDPRRGDKHPHIAAMGVPAPKKSIEKPVSAAAPVPSNPKVVGGTPPTVHPATGDGAVGTSDPTAIKKDDGSAKTGAPSDTSPETKKQPEDNGSTAPKVAPTTPPGTAG